MIRANGSPRTTSQWLISAGRCSTITPVPGHPKIGEDEISLSPDAAGHHWRGDFSRIAGMQLWGRADATAAQPTCARQWDGSRATHQRADGGAAYAYAHTLHPKCAASDRAGLLCSAVLVGGQPD